MHNAIRIGTFLGNLFVIYIILPIYHEKHQIKTQMQLREIYSI